MRNRSVTSMWQISSLTRALCDLYLTGYKRLQRVSFLSTPYNAEKTNGTNQQEIQLQRSCLIERLITQVINVSLPCRILGEREFLRGSLTGLLFIINIGIVITRSFYPFRQQWGSCIRIAVRPYPADLKLAMKWSMQQSKSCVCTNHKCMRFVGYNCFSSPPRK